MMDTAMTWLRRLVGDVATRSRLALALPVSLALHALAAVLLLVLLPRTAPESVLVIDLTEPAVASPAPAVNRLPQGTPRREPRRPSTAAGARPPGSGDRARKVPPLVRPVQPSDTGSRAASESRVSPAPVASREADASRETAQGERPVLDRPRPERSPAKPPLPERPPAPAPVTSPQPLQEQARAPGAGAAVSWPMELHAGPGRTSSADSAAARASEAVAEGASAAGGGRTSVSGAPSPGAGSAGGTRSPGAGDGAAAPGPRGSGGALGGSGRSQTGESGSGPDGGGRAQGQVSALASGSSGGAGGTGDWEALLRRRIAEALRYPPSARRQGLAGTVELEIVVRPDGRVADVKVLASSSHRLLDEAAVETVRRLPRIPAPAALQGVELRIVLPVAFDLR
jgi:TonB family protein